MFCPKCGTQNPDGSKFCSGCGQPLAPATQSASQPASAPQPAPQPAAFATSRAAGPAAYSTAGAVRHTGIAVGPVWLSYALIPVLVVAGILLFQSWAEIPLAQISYATSGSAQAGAPSSIGFGVLGVSQLAGTIGSLGSLAGNFMSSSQVSALSSVTQATVPLAIVTLLWAASLVLIAVNVHELLMHKGAGEKLLIACGVVLVALCVAWMLFVGSVDSSILSAFGAASQFVTFHVFVATPFVWATLVLGVVCIVAPVLERLGIIR